LGGNAASVDGDISLYRDTRSNGDLKIGTVSAGLDIVNGLGGTAKASANLINFKTDGVEVKGGINLDTGGSISSNGLELKVAGFGVSIGKKLEISTIGGGVSKDMGEDCVIQ
jgi:hypothetical protein